MTGMWTLWRLGDPQDQRREELLNHLSRPTTEDEEQFKKIEEHPRLEGRFRAIDGVLDQGILTTGKAEDPHGGLLMGRTQKTHGVYKEGSRRLGAYSRDSAVNYNMIYPICSRHSYNPRPPDTYINWGQGM
jgi:hypothetical protein